MVLLCQGLVQKKELHTVKSIQREMYQTHLQVIIFFSNAIQFIIIYIVFIPLLSHTGWNMQGSFRMAREAGYNIGLSSASGTEGPWFKPW